MPSQSYLIFVMLENTSTGTFNEQQNLFSLYLSCSAKQNIRQRTGVRLERRVSIIKKNVWAPTNKTYTYISDSLIVGKALRGAGAWAPALSGRVSARVKRTRECPPLELYSRRDRLVSEAKQLSLMRADRHALLTPAKAGAHAHAGAWAWVRLTPEREPLKLSAYALSLLSLYCGRSRARGSYRPVVSVEVLKNAFSCVELCSTQGRTTI